MLGSESRNIVSAELVTRYGINRARNGLILCPSAGIERSEDELVLKVDYKMYREDLLIKIEPECVRCEAII